MEDLAPRIRTGETPPKVQNIQGAPTSTFAMLGIFQKGPIGVPTFTAGPEDVRKIFGGPIAGGLGQKGLALAYSNGAGAGYVTRVVHYTDPSDLSTSTAIASFKAIDDRIPNAGVAASGSVKVANNAIEEWEYAVASFDVINNAIDAGDKLTINGEDFQETVDFVVGGTAALTATAIMTAINASIAPAISGVLTASINISNPIRVLLTAVVPGTAGNALTLVEVDGATNNFTISGATFSGGANGDSLTVGAITLQFGIDIALGVTSILTALAIQVAVNALVAVSAAIDPTDTTRVLVTAAAVGTAGNSIALTKVDADNDLTLSGATLTGGSDPESEIATTVTASDGPGTHANGRIIRISAAKNALASWFRLDVLSSAGVVQDSFDNLNLNPASSDYAELRINGRQNKLITFVDEESTNTLGNNNLPALGDHLLAGGNDGLVGITDQDFIGDSGTKTGIYAWKNLEARFALACCWERPTLAVQQAGRQFAELQKHFAWIEDTPAGQTAAQVVAYKSANGISSEFSALYWPLVVISDMTPGISFGSDLVIGNSPVVLGRCAATDNAVGKGVAKAPAGIVDGAIKGIVRLETDVTQDQAVRDLLFPDGINPLWSEQGVGPFIDGARLTKLDGLVSNFNERRVFIFVEVSIAQGIRYAKHENIEEKLYNSLNATVTVFLTRFWRQGGLRGAIPQEAFYVDFTFGSGTINPPSEAEASRVNGEIGIATKKPGYFFTISFTVDQRALLAELAG